MGNVRIDTLPDDLFLVSYPKSGNTWLRYLFAHYLSGDTAPDFLTLIPDIYKNLEQLADLPRPRYIKSHEPFCPEYPRVIYITRDGRDVAVSYYFYMQSRKRIPKGIAFEDYLKAFNADQLDPFSTWSVHVHSWLDQAPEQFLLLRYEDMKADIQTQFLRCLEFANIPVDMERVAFAIDCCNFERLQEQEKGWYQQLGNTPLHPFFRKGTCGQWREFFTDEMVQEFMACHGSAMERLGYVDGMTSPEGAYNPVRRELERTVAQQISQYLLLKQELAAVQQQLEQANAALTSIQSGKVWTLYQVWAKVKQRLALS